MKLLNDEQIQQSLMKLDLNWSATDNSRLERTFVFPDFKSALGFVIKVGGLAEKQNHHPDIQLSWGKVVIGLRTHSAGGVTRNDFELASAIDSLGGTYR